ncbi:hypothetical protein NKJ84_26700 [Mesorhizobium sp. M0048]|uniref:hypothetical protein n=1 Tax=Mesorhizobium sp. M0048 TaxID=2956860 RepID=UPI00333AB99F
MEQHVRSSLERKMGIDGQPTCVMNDNGSIAWHAGEPGLSLNAMLTMTNAERLLVGIQCLGIAEAKLAGVVARRRG